MNIRRKYSPETKTFELTFSFTEADLKELPLTLVHQFRQAWKNNNSKNDYAQFIYRVIQQESYRQAQFEQAERLRQARDYFNQQTYQYSGGFGNFGRRTGSSTEKLFGSAYSFMEPSWVKILGVSRSASKSEIKKAYRELVKTHHPDKGGDPKKFDEITKAYDEAINSK